VRALPLVLTAVLLGSLTACGQDAAPKPAAATGYHGVEPLKTVTRPSYVLRDTAGKTFDFQAETKGRPTFVYFGYTNCPDECPTAMADIAAALRKTTPEVRAATRVVFVTTDPKRDTAPVLRRWLDQFSTEFVGLLGTQAQLDAAQRASGVEPARAAGPVPTIPGHPDEHVHKEGTAPHKHFGPLGYSVSHSAVIFAYNAADRLPVVYPGGVTPSDIAADLPVLARP
jgi:protein SCO1/2